MLWWKKYTVLWPFSFSYSVTHLSHHHLMDHPAAAAGQVGSLPRIPTTVSHVVVVPVCHPRARVARPPWLRMRLNECGLDAVSVLSERVGVSCSGSERWLAEWRSVVSWIWLRTVNDSLDSRQRRRTPFGWRRHYSFCSPLIDRRWVFRRRNVSTIFSTVSTVCEKRCRRTVSASVTVRPGHAKTGLGTRLSSPSIKLYQQSQIRKSRSGVSLQQCYGEVQSSVVPTCELQVLPSAVNRQPSSLLRPASHVLFYFYF